MTALCYFYCGPIGCLVGLLRISRTFFPARNLTSQHFVMTSAIFAFRCKPLRFPAFALSSTEPALPAFALSSTEPALPPALPAFFMRLQPHDRQRPKSREYGPEFLQRGVLHLDRGRRGMVQAMESQLGQQRII